MNGPTNDFRIYLSTLFIMSQQPSIVFDQQETDLMYDPALFPLKRRINHKLYALFEQLKNLLKDTSIHREFNFPADCDTVTGKISQGENHQAYPWVMLDFPKLFHKNRIFSFRTLFWYGHGFSNSIVVGGDCCETYIEKLLSNKSNLHDHNIYFSFAPDPWEHEVNGADSRLLESVFPAALLEQVSKHQFFKLSNRFSGNSGEVIINKSLQNYNHMLGVLS